MRKLFIILPIILVLLCSCDPYVNKKPYSYGTSVWVCTEPNITYVVEMKYNDYEEMEIPETYAIAIIDGKEVKFNLGFLYDTVDAIEYIEENTEETVGKIHFSGTCKYSDTQFTIYVGTDTDVLFNGEYEELVFNRVME